MEIETQIRIKSNPIFEKFLRENSYWYKYLNRNKTYFKNFEEDLKKKYKLTAEDKMNDMREKIESLSKIMDILN